MTGNFGGKIFQRIAEIMTFDRIYFGGCARPLDIMILLWIKNLTSQGSQGTDVDCHSFYQMFQPNLGPSSVVDQRYRAW